MLGQEQLVESLSQAQPPAQGKTTIHKLVSQRMGHARVFCDPSPDWARIVGTALCVGATPAGSEVHGQPDKL
eukprot:scaffold527_cov368-Prasinococcus_capsulatus_cf.AAC.24